MEDLLQTRRPHATTAGSSIELSMHSVSFTCILGCSPHLQLDLRCFLVSQMCCCGIHQLGCSGLQLSLQLLCVFSCLQLLPAGKTCSMLEAHACLPHLQP